ACGSADKGCGCITWGLWKAKNRGNLMPALARLCSIGYALSWLWSQLECFDANRFAEAVPQIREEPVRIFVGEAVEQIVSHAPA
ncbi:hypothetical protein, partial [Burkholderia ubonensis]|uniref:hypothetical protein n=1 Tax=Burkholderia ubonensis TaxID=101571 RepID=UPI001E29377C